MNKATIITVIVQLVVLIFLGMTFGVISVSTFVGYCVGFWTGRLIRTWEIQTAIRERLCNIQDCCPSKEDSSV